MDVGRELGGERTRTMRGKGVDPARWLEWSNGARRASISLPARAGTPRLGRPQPQEKRSPCLWRNSQAVVKAPAPSGGASGGGDVTPLRSSAS